MKKHFKLTREDALHLVKAVNYADTVMAREDVEMPELWVELQSRLEAFLIGEQEQTCAGTWIPFTDVEEEELVDEEGSSDAPATQESGSSAHAACSEEVSEGASPQSAPCCSCSKDCCPAGCGSSGNTIVEELVVDASVSVLDLHDLKPVVCSRGHLEFEWDPKEDDSCLLVEGYKESTVCAVQRTKDSLVTYDYDGVRHEQAGVTFTKQWKKLLVQGMTYEVCCPDDDTEDSEEE